MSHPGIGEQLARALGASRPRGVVSVYLYGSQAEGRAHRESDVDVGVLLDRAEFPEARDRFEARLSLSDSVGAALHHDDVSVVVLNDVPPGLSRHIVTSGQRVYCSAADADHAFVRDTQLRAADLDLFLKRMRKIKLRALGGA
jgi:predicted nucleotidyltransferase